MDRELLLENVNREFNRNYESFDEIYSWIVWAYISNTQELSEDFIREFQHKVHWYCISRCQTLSEYFIREFKDRVDWWEISAHQKLSEDFIRDFQNKVDWFYIPRYQTLSEDFIREFQDKVDWHYISDHQKLSKEFIEEFNLKIDEDNWLYKDTEFKKQQVVDCGLYECHDDYFIAYKGIKKDGKSSFDPRYKYEVGKTYESRANFTNKESSFGLSAWTYERARDYCDERIVKVKVYYEDVARVVHGDYKIRCAKQEILEIVK